MIEKETTVGLQTEPDNVFVIENEQKDQEKAKNASDPIGHNLSLGRRISQGDSSHMLTR